MRHIAIKDAALNRVLKGKTAVHLSDLHINTASGNGKKKFSRIIDERTSDLILLTGDYVKWKGNDDRAH